MSPIAIVLLVAAVALVGAAEWGRIARGRKFDLRGDRSRKRRKSNLRVVEPSSDTEEFARSVERDLAALPTIDEHDAKHH